MIYETPDKLPTLLLEVESESIRDALTIQEILGEMQIIIDDLVATKNKCPGVICMLKSDFYWMGDELLLLAGKAGPAKPPKNYYLNGILIRTASSISEVIRKAFKFRPSLVIDKQKVFLVSNTSRRF